MAESACVLCGKTRRLAGRGLCKPCYRHEAAAGRIGTWPTAWGADRVEVDGVTARQLDYWVRRGYLRPKDPTPGSGVWRDWPAGEIRVARRMARLVAAGFGPALAERAARCEHRCELAPGVWVDLDMVDGVSRG